MMETVSFTNIGKRDEQQDRCGIYYLDLYEKEKSGLVAFLADGIGGLENGGIASSIIQETVEENTKDLTEISDPIHYLLEIVDHAQAKVKQSVYQDGVSTGSTMIISCIYEKKMFYASVGDSRIYLYRGGKLLQLNRENCYYRDLAVLASRGTISWESAQSDPQGKALTKYIGMEIPGQPDFNLVPVRLQDDDYIIMMSDGVYGSISDEDMETIFEKKDMKKAAKELEQTILLHDKENQDNFTCIMIKI